MRIQVLNYLICPNCHNFFTFSTHKKIKRRILNVKLGCKTCNKKFYIKNGIACFVSSCRKPTMKTVQKLRKTTLKQEIPKKWMRLYSKEEIKALKKEWDWMLSVVSKKRDTVHLDFATGTGRFLRNIVSKIKGEIIVLEQDYPACRELQYFLKKIKKYSRVSIICADARKMPFKDGIFNSISSWHGIDEPKMEKAIKESNRVLRKNGFLAVSGIHYQKQSKSFLRAKKHGIRFITKEIITQLLRKAGFYKIEYKIFFEGRWNEIGSYLPVFEDFYLTYTVKAKK